MYFCVCRDSQTLISADFGDVIPQQYYAYFTWYENGVRLGYTAVPSVSDPFPPPYISIDTPLICHPLYLCESGFSEFTEWVFQLNFLIQYVLIVNIKYVLDDVHIWHSRSI